MGEVRKSYSVYVMTNKRNGTLYVGVSGRLLERVRDHKNGTQKGFTKRYQLNQLVYFETFDGVNNAIRREKQLKNGSRRKKLQLIESMNPDWADLSAEWYD